MQVIGMGAIRQVHKTRVLKQRRPGEEEVGLQLVVRAAVDPVALEQIGGTPIGSEQHHWDTLYLPSEGRGPQNPHPHSTIVEATLQDYVGA